MTIDLDHLETVAKAATRGPWLKRYEDVYSEVDAHVAFCLTVCSSAEEHCITKQQAQANAAFIAAANPTTMLALIAEIRKLREELDLERSAVERSKELDAMMEDDELMEFMQKLAEGTNND